MTSRTETRKWTATISIGGETVPADLPAPRYHEGFMGVPDLLSETRKAALAQAAEYIRAEMGDDASVAIYKQLKGDPEPVWDRSGGYVWREMDGRILVDRSW
jgi:hypothetical protein